VKVNRPRFKDLGNSQLLRSIEKGGDVMLKRHVLELIIKRVFSAVPEVDSGSHISVVE
jgi:hypothetical protein